MFDNDTIRTRITAILDQRIIDNAKKNGITKHDAKKQLREEGVCSSINALALKAQIAPADFYSALNGNKPFYPAWRARIADALDVAEVDIFGEEHDK